METVASCFNSANESPQNVLVPKEVVCSHHQITGSGVFSGLDGFVHTVNEPVLAPARGKPYNEQFALKLLACVGQAGWKLSLAVGVGHRWLKLFRCRSGVRTKLLH